MGAFCVFGVSKSICKDRAGKKVSETYDPDLKRMPTVPEWAEKRNALAEKLFEEQIKREKISPEFDAPQFCRDWVAADPFHVKMPIIMVRAEKTDKNGERVIRKGVPVMTWVEWVEPNKSLF